MSISKDLMDELHREAEEMFTTNGRYILTTDTKVKLGTEVQALAVMFLLRAAHINAVIRGLRAGAGAPDDIRAQWALSAGEGTSA